jgi:hypothetical protein
MRLVKLVELADGNVTATTQSPSGLFWFVQVEPVPLLVIPLMAANAVVPASKAMAIAALAAAARTPR